MCYIDARVADIVVWFVGWDSIHLYIYSISHIDKIVLKIKSTETQTEVETQSMKKRRHTQIHVVRWSPVKRRACRVAATSLLIVLYIYYDNNTVDAGC